MPRRMGKRVSVSDCLRAKSRKGLRDFLWVTGKRL
jgi:hypothetical protein